MERLCRICNKLKPLSAFKKFRDRIFHQCVECCVAQAKARRLANPDKFNKRRRELYVGNREKIIADVSKWRKENRQKVKVTNRKYELKRDPVKQLARRLLKQAVKCGKIVKPLHCECCGQAMPKVKLHGHHKDYSKPFLVKWFCNNCHATHHRIERNS